VPDPRERIARNEAISRDINEGIEDAMSPAFTDGYARMLCECGDALCESKIAISVAEYEDARRDALRFIVVRDHVIGDVELVVSETDRYAVVEKREGAPAEVARELDPRG
jgi:hypothetical protein